MALAKYEESPEEFKQLLRSIEYEVQFFKVSSYSIYFNLKRYALRQIRVGLVAIRNSLMKRSQSNEEEECREIIKRLNMKYELVVEKCFREHENKFFSVFKIPSFILLPENQVHNKQYTVSNVKEIDEEIEHLKLRYKKAICLASILKEEKRQYSNLDIIMIKVMELEEDINNYSNTFASTQLSWEDAVNVLDELKSLYDQMKLLIV